MGIIAIGDNALYSNTTGCSNIAIGFNSRGGGQSALQSCTTGSFNQAIGTYALSGVTTGSNNCGIGENAGSNVTTGTGNTYIGNSNSASSGGVNYELVVSASGGSTGKGGSTGFINAGSGGVYQGNNSSTWSTTSDRRLKKNIVDNANGLTQINSIRVRNFEYRLPEEVDAELKPTDAIKKSGVQLGVIAQELQEVLPDCVKQESTGVLSVDPDNLTWYLINAVKELTARIQVLESRQ
jgi:hypothetical protein